jgi:endonuclease-3
MNLNRAHAQLVRHYGPIRFRPRGDALAQLIQTILSQHTSDLNSDRAWRSLRQRFRSWRVLADAPVASVRDSIRMGGLAGIKAPRIQQVLRMVRQREGRYSLKRIEALDNATALNYLMGLPGVGHKTAACVLMFGLGRPVMPVDTHVERVAKRLGWAAPQDSPADISAKLETRLPPENMASMHLVLVTHGRQTCRARNPRCDSCPLKQTCPSRTA